MTQGEGNSSASCPECGKALDGWTAAEEGTHPEEGDVSLCLYCRAILVFRADLTLRAPTPAERAVAEELVRKAFGGQSAGSMA